MSDSVGVAVLGLGLFLFVVMAIGLYFAPPSSPMQKAPTAPPGESPAVATPPPLPDDYVLQDTFDQLARLGEAERTRAEEDAKIRPWLRPIGFCARLLTYATLFLLLYMWAPSDISNTPLGALTLSDIVKTAAFIGFGIVLVRALFRPSEDDGIRDAWGWFGVLLVCAIGIVVVYIYNMR